MFWDRFHLNIRFANWSLVSACGKIQEMFGDSSYGFLSESYRDSGYLLEMERGGAQGSPGPEMSSAGGWLQRPSFVSASCS